MDGKWLGGLVAGLVIAISLPVMAADMDPELRERAKRAVDGGLFYLRNAQEDDGSWKGSVGVTALGVRAFLTAHRGYSVEDGPFIERPVNFILSHAREDGAISESLKNLNYNTATALFALQAADDPRYADVIANGQAFLAYLQADEGEGYTRDHRFYGGLGYGGDERPDMPNTTYALESLRATAFDPESEVWEKAIVFVSRTQNWSETNDQEWAGNDGGFTYMPGWSPHDDATISYGGMTASGLINLIFAGVDRDDPRIQAAWEWMRANYTLEENPGTASGHGLYYYYSAFAKAMRAMDKDIITSPDGVEHNWRNDLVEAILALQLEDGSFYNPYSDRWWEKFPELVTARAVIALNLVLN